MFDNPFKKRLYNQNCALIIVNVKRFTILFGVFLMSVKVYSQDFTKVKLNNITITGNKTTKAVVVFNELDIKLGDSLEINKLTEIINRNEKRLQSIGIFTLVKINIGDWDTDKSLISLDVDVRESWFIYPAPIFEFADRSFNAWWKEHNFSFKRVNYGVRLDHLNTTGYQDKLKLKFQLGYTKRYELNYSFPYLSKGWGGGVIIDYRENKEIPYKTENNTLLFYQDEDERDMLRRFKAGFFITNRNNAYLRQRLSLEIHRNWVDTLVITQLNPNYFLDGQNSIIFPFMEYDLNYDKRIFPIYPEGGFMYSINIKKSGITNNSDYNNLAFEFRGEAYKRLAKNTYGGLGGSIKFNAIRNTLAYANNTAIGYGVRLRGYDISVIDGSDYFFLKGAIRHQILYKVVNLGKFMPLRQFKLLPININLRLSGDSGYVNERTYKETNTLNNRLLFGYGPALDILIINNYLFSMEYNFNQFGGRDLYLQSSFNF
jgi:outer membrane protein assembly factor BamA